MKTIRFLFCLLTAIGFFSCTQEEVFIEGTPSKGLVAEIPDYQFEGATRVSISKDLSTFTWSDNDQIGLYYQVGTDAASAVFTTLKGGTSSSTFTNSAFALKPSSTYYAFYPYSSSATVGAYPVDFTGQVQSGNGGTSHIGARNYMTATVQTDNSGDASINFKNVGSVVQVVLPVDKATTFTSLSISTDTEAFITRGKVNMKTGTISATEKSKEVKLSFGSGITLSAGGQLTANILMAPVDLSDKNLTFTLSYKGGEGLFSTTGKKMSAGKAYRFNGETLEEIPYLTFMADATQTLTMSKAVETLEYSVNGASWKELGTNTVTFGGANGDLMVRGKSNMGTASSYTDYSKISFGNTTKVACSGDIRTLVDYVNYSTIDTSNARFCFLFYKCSSLTSAPRLPATTLTDDCYSNMFCGCSSLTSAPELPATTLADYCYYEMFMYCSSLTSAPELPATTLAYGCYGDMFINCSSLTRAPELLATTLTEWCYNNMFNGCTNLNYIKMMAIDISAYNCLDGWPYHVSSTGTFVKNAEATWSNEGVVPSGWNVQYEGGNGNGTGTIIPGNEHEG